MICSFFLGANTPEGFYSLFGELSGFDLHVVKGSCGSGKSTLLNTIAGKTPYSGICERILCASDTHSLDGVVFHSLKAAAVDGTAPHTAEVSGLGRYIVMPCPKPGVFQHREQIYALKEQKAQAYKRAYACLKGALYARGCARSQVVFDTDRLIKRAEGILEREARPRHTPSRLHRRFIDAFTSGGYMTLSDTIETLANRIYVIEDRLSQASPLLQALQSGLLERGYEVYSCLDPMQPANIRHIIVPELHLAFVTSDRLSVVESDVYRRLHLTAYTDQNSLKSCRAKIRLFEKLQDALLEQAFDELKAARLAHIELEKIYLPYLDLPELKKLNENISL